MITLPRDLFLLTLATVRAYAKSLGHSPHAQDKINHLIDRLERLYNAQG